MSKLDSSVVAYANWVIRWRWVVILASVLIALGIGYGGSKIGFDNDYRVFFSEDNPQLRAFEELQARYTKNDNVMFVLAPKDGNTFSPESLTAMEELTEASWQIPYSIRVDSITNFQHTWSEADDLVVEDLVANAVERPNTYLEERKEVALSEPLLLDRLIPPDARVFAVNVTLQLPDNDQMAVPQAAAFARQMVAEFTERHPDIAVYLTGIVMLNNAFVESSMTDMTTLVPAMYMFLIGTMFILFLWVSIRFGTLLGSALATGGAVIGTVLVIAFSTMAGMGMAGWMGINITPPSASAPTMIMTLAVADSIHILISILEQMRSGKSRKDAIIESLRINMQPVFLTSLTTVIGFLSLNASDAPPFRDVGNITAMGVAAAFFFSVLFLPAFMSIIPATAKASSTQRATGMDHLANFVIARRNSLFWGISVVIVVLVAMVPQIDLNDRFVEYFDESIQFRNDTDFAMENLSGIYQINYSLPAEDTMGVSEPRYLEDLEAFAEWYRSQPNVVHVQTITDMMRRLNKNMHGDDPDWYVLPDDRELAAQYLLLYEMSLPYGLDLNNQINVDKSQSRVVVTLSNISTREARELEARAQDWLVANVPETMRSEGSGSFIMFANISKRNIETMLVGTVTALVLISLSLILFLKTVKFGLASLIPNLAPAGMAFGIWAVAIGEANVAISIVTAMTLGIVVDFTVHFLSKYLRARREGNRSPEDAVRYAFNTVGMALWVTSIVLFVGFMVLSQSGFLLNSWMGILTAITIAIALIADFFYLPPILMRLERGRDEKSAELADPKPA